MSHVIGIEPVYLRKLETVQFDGPAPYKAPPIQQNSASTIATADPIKSEGPSFKPILPSPQRHFMLPLIDIQIEMNRLINMQGVNFEVEMKNDLAKLKTLHAERLETLRLHAHEIAAKNSWSVWRTVSQFVASASLIFVGIQCMAIPGGVIPGSFLIASGGLAIANEVMTSTGGWQMLVSQFQTSREMQTKIADQINSNLSYISLGLAMAGAIGAYQVGAYALLIQEELRNQALQMATTVLAIGGFAIGTLSTIGGAYAENKIQNCRADLKLLDSKDFQLKQEIKQDSAEVRKMIEISNEIADIIKKAIATLI